MRAYILKAQNYLHTQNYDSVKATINTAVALIDTFNELLIPPFTFSKLTYIFVINLTYIII